MIRWLFGTVRKRALTFLAGFIFAVLCFIGINAAMVSVSTSEYCGTKCHEMKTVYQSWEISAHGSNANGITVDCIDCHLPPREKYFTHLAYKAYAGGKDIYKQYFGPEYDAEKMRKKVIDNMTNDMCNNCHDNLMGKPSNSAARIAHMASLARPDDPDNRCMVCHEDTCHKRDSKLFSE